MRKRIWLKFSQMLIGLVAKNIVVQFREQLFFSMDNTAMPILVHKRLYLCHQQSVNGIREAVSFLSGKLADLKGCTDSSAARGIVSRKGVAGRVKQMQTRLTATRCSQLSSL